MTAIACLVLIWKCPTLILSERAARQEVDMRSRRERNRFSYGVPQDDPEERRRQEEEFRARYPRFEDLEIEEVLLEQSDG